MFRPLVRFTVAFALAAAAVIAFQPAAYAQAEQQKLVGQAETTSSAIPT